MKKLFFPTLVLCILVAAAAAQKLPKPTQLPSPLSAEESKTLNAGIVHHDAKRYDEAIAQYDKILSGNADATIALYEKALSLYAKGDRDKAMEVAYIGAKYKSDELAMFYSIMANCLDDVGKSEEALKVYREAESMLKSDIGMARHLSSVYFNIGVTYVRQKKYNEARAELKKAVETNFGYASPHYLLSVVYQGTKYKIPAFAAAARFLTLEYNSQRSATAANIITEVLKPAEKGRQDRQYKHLHGPQRSKGRGRFRDVRPAFGNADNGQERQRQRQDRERDLRRCSRYRHLAFVGGQKARIVLCRQTIRTVSRGA